MVWVLIGIIALLFFGVGWFFHRIESNKLSVEKETDFVKGSDTCVMCGAYVPEGRMVCDRCMEDE